LLLGASCTEPSFVSLGGNVTRAALATDAGWRASDLPIDAGEPVPLRTCGDEAERVLVTSDCAARSSVECPALGPVQYEVDDQLSILLRECLGFNDLLSVRFGDSGCAVSFGLDLNGSDPTPEVEACVANRLASERYACAGGVACGVGNAFQVPAR